MSNALTNVRDIKLQPIKLGELLDKAFRLTPKVFGRLFLFIVIASALAVLGGIPELSQSTETSWQLTAVFCTLLSSIFGFYVMVAGVLLAGEIWLGNLNVSREDIKPRITIRLVGRVIWLSVLIVFGTAFWAIFLLIPGLVFFIRRILAYYILIIEDMTVSDAIKKSKQIMRMGKWYRSNSPLFRVSVIGLLSIVLGAVCGAVLVGGMTIQMASAGTGILVTALVMFAMTIFQHLLSIFGSTAYAGVYFDARARFEAADIVSDLSEESRFTQEQPRI